MKKLVTFLAILALIALVAYFGILAYLKSGPTEPSNQVWSPYLGYDTTVAILPDQYANYFTYTIVKRDPDMGFKISGKFPKTRYFSFNVYSLGDNTTQGSIIDYQIETDSGKPNPFLQSADSGEVGDRYTVYLVPKSKQPKGLKNVLPFKDDMTAMTVAIRLYDYDIDDFGGEEYPVVEAFTIEGDNHEELTEARLPRNLDLKAIVHTVSLPGMVDRLGLVYQTEYTAAIEHDRNETKYQSIPFHAIDTRGYIENNDNRYLLAAIIKEPEEVFAFKFKAPTYTTGPENINQTDVRYWSFNLGNRATYNFNALKDEDALIDEDGFVTIVLGDNDAAVQAKCADLGINFLEWNMDWSDALILFRHMLAHPDFEAQIDDVTPINADMSTFSEIEGHNFMGDYAPQGQRMSKSDFLQNY